MTEKEVIREVLNQRRWSQSQLAKEAGFRSQSNIGGLLNTNTCGIRIDILVRIFKALGCEIVVRDKMGSRKEWIIDSTGKSSANKEEL